jgi:hypothetical protein
MTEAKCYCEYITKNCRLSNPDQRTTLDLVVDNFVREGWSLIKANLRRALGEE